MNMETKENTTVQAQPVAVSFFAAIDKVLQSNVIKPTEVKATGRDYVCWGKNNDYPEYLLQLRKNAATLKSIISGCCDYAVGDKVECNLPYNSKYMNREKKTARDVLTNLFRDLFTYGGFAFEVIRSEAGDVVEIYYIDFRFLRTNEERTVFWYSEDWHKRFGKKKDLTLPKFDPDAKEVKESIVYYCNSDSQVYPESPFEAAVMAAELERAIDEYHWNSMNNSFSGSYIVNMNNGVPADEVREEIEKDFNQKFSGHKNAGRVMFSWNVDRDHMATLQEMKSSDFADKYDALAKRSRQQLFTAYRANPNLFGIPTENLGFSSEEYESAFKLFNRTVIQPAQQRVIEALTGVYDANIVITPFTLDGEGENKETAQNE